MAKTDDEEFMQAFHRAQDQWRKVFLEELTGDLAFQRLVFGDRAEQPLTVRQFGTVMLALREVQAAELKVMMNTLATVCQNRQE